MADPLDVSQLPQIARPTPTIPAAYKTLPGVGFTAQGPATPGGFSPEMMLGVGPEYVPGSYAPEAMLGVKPPTAAAPGVAPATAPSPVTAGLPEIGNAAPNERESRLSVVPGMSQEEIARINATPTPSYHLERDVYGQLNKVQDKPESQMQVTRIGGNGLPMTPRELATEATQKLAQTGMNIKQQEANTAQENVYGENAFRAMQGRTMGSAHLGEINKQKMHDEYLDPTTPEDRRERIAHILGVIKPDNMEAEKDVMGAFTGRVLNKATGEMKGGPTAPAPKEGSRHQDANGNIATWTGGKWVPEKK